MSTKKLLYCWNITKFNDIKTNQNVKIQKCNKYLLATICQDTSTPGIIINKQFNANKNKVYLLEIDGLSCRSESAFLWAEDSSDKRIIENYTYLSNDKFNQSNCAGFKLNYDSCISIGVLVTNPKKGDKFFIKEINLYELDGVENYTNDSDSINSEDCNIPCHQTNNNYNENIKLDTNEYDTINNIVSSNCPISNQYNTQYSSNNYIGGGCPLNTQTYENHLNIKSCYKFCKLFDLPNLNISDQNLINFVENAISKYDNKSNLNTNVPGGFVFFGQFLAHDITFNLSNTKLYSNNKTNGNFRTPHLDLDCLYGDPGEKYLFNNNKFIINDSCNDLNRTENGVPIIPDQRNDENYIIAQMHLLFQLFHNKLIDYYSNKNIENIFEYVKREVVFTYQWIVVNDYLSRIIDNDILDSIFKYGTKFYSSKNEDSCIPQEFAVAAFRFGHFTINNYYNIAYDYNIPEEKIHHYTKGVLPDYIIDWSKFFNVIDTKVPQASKKIEPKIVNDLHDMIHLDKPVDLKYMKNSLFIRNLIRGQQVGLPSGQDIANKMGITPISNDIMKQYDLNNNLSCNGMLDKTPLLIYILKEAEIFKGGKMLTGVGGIIVAEVILSLLFDDSNTYFNSPDKWTPTLPSKIKGQFLMADLINFVYS